MNRSPVGEDERAPRGKALLGKPGDLSLIPGTHIKVGREKLLPRILFSAVTVRVQQMVGFSPPTKGTARTLSTAVSPNLIQRFSQSINAEAPNPKNIRNIPPSLAPEGVAKAG